MRCDEIAVVLPEMVDRTGPIDASVAGHVETCFRCQAELARYKRLLRGLQLLRTQFLEPAPGLLASTLVAVTEASERRAIRSVLSGRRAAYAGAIAAATVAGVATGAVVLTHRARRRSAALVH